ncbi:MAG: diguanylate cyclase, partial [Sulfuricurvum sp.]|nr:diguanylate cyclase [Sulfuricurvum sp.]
RTWCRLFTRILYRQTGAVNMIRFFIIISLVVASLCAQTLTFGVFTYRAPEKILKEYQPIANYLSRELNATVVIKPLSQENLEREVHEGKIDIIATNPTHYLSLRTQGKTTGAIATLIKRQGEITTSHLGGVIISSANRGDIRTIDDLKNKTIAIPGKKFLGGYQTQAYELLLNGMDVQHNVQTRTLKNHEAVVQSVLSGHTDAGFIRTGILEEMVRDHALNLDQLFIINEQHFRDFPFKISTRLYPEWSVVTKQELPSATVAKIAIALYGYHSHEEGNDVISGFTIPGDYEEVDDLARMLRIPPYNYAPSFTLRDIWNQYRIAILIVSTLTFIFILILSWMVRKMHFQKAYVRSILDASPNPMILTDKEHLIDTNKALLKLLGYPSLEALKSEHTCICDFFEEGETNEYLLPMMDDQTWVEYVLEHPEREHKVKITIGGEIALFKVDASMVGSIKETRAIVVFTDISLMMSQSTTDALTGIANRTHFNLIFEHTLHASRRGEGDLSIVFFDIDHFKNINDTYGHLVGDDVLRHIASLAKSTLRKSDIIARWGGEEFILLLPNTPLSSAAWVAENLRERIDNEPFDIVGHITCSFGVCTLCENEGADEFLYRVDELLYQAKESGRNRVVIG